jgi:hypothetical protein
MPRRRSTLAALLTDDENSHRCDAKNVALAHPPLTPPRVRVRRSPLAAGLRVRALRARTPHAPACAVGPLPPQASSRAHAAMASSARVVDAASAADFDRLTSGGLVRCRCVAPARMQGVLRARSVQRRRSRCHACVCGALSAGCVPLLGELVRAVRADGRRVRAPGGLHARRGVRAGARWQRGCVNAPQHATPTLPCACV